MKKQKKKYNKFKGIEAVTSRALKGLFVFSSSATGYTCQLVDKKGNTKPVTPTIYKAVADVKHMWGVYLSVFGVDNNKSNYSKSNFIECKTRYFQRDLVEFLASEHEKIIKNFNGEHIRSAGWLASATGEELTESEAAFIFDKMGCWNV